MKLVTQTLLTCIASAAFASASQAATIMRLESFDPYNYFTNNFLAGVDFDVDSSGDPGPQYETEAGFTSIPAANAKSYNAVNNGITFDFQVTNANLGNQARFRGASNLPKAGPLLIDFEQWYGRYATQGNAVEVAITISGLNAGQTYEISSFNYNVGAGQVTHSYYDGASSADPFLLTNQSSGNPNDYNNWDPGVIITKAADSNGEIVFTIQAVEYQAGSNWESRLTLTGLSIVPEPSSMAFMVVGAVALVRRRRG